MNEEALILIDEIRTGKLTVKGYSSEWMRRPDNHRKITIIVEDKR